MGEFPTRHQLLFRFSRTLAAQFVCFNSVRSVSQNEKVSHMKNFLNDESGVIISAELVLVLTICVIGVIVGLSHVVVAVNQELTDVAKAIGSLNQSFKYTGFKCCTHGADPVKSTSNTPGSAFSDGSDVCDDATCANCDPVTCDVSVESKASGT